MAADSPLVARTVRTGGTLLALAAAQFVAVLLWVQDRTAGFNPWSTGLATLGHVGTTWAIVLDASLVALGLLTAVGLLFSWSAFDPRPSRGLGLLVLLVGAAAASLSGAFLLLASRLPASAVPGAFAATVVAAGFGLVIISSAMHQHGRWRVSATYTLVTGLVLLGGGALDYAHLRFGLGAGGLERVVLGAALLWALVEGAHLALLHRFAPGLVVKVTAA